MGELAQTLVADNFVASGARCPTPQERRHGFLFCAGIFVLGWSRRPVVTRSFVLSFSCDCLCPCLHVACQWRLLSLLLHGLDRERACFCLALPACLSLAYSVGRYVVLRC